MGVAGSDEEKSQRAARAVGGQAVSTPRLAAALQADDSAERPDGAAALLRHVFDVDDGDQRRRRPNVVRREADAGFWQYPAKRAAAERWHAGRLHAGKRAADAGPRRR